MQETSKKKKKIVKIESIHLYQIYFHSIPIAQQRRGSVEDLMYNVDIDGSSLLHLATNSGVLGVSTTV